MTSFTGIPAFPSYEISISGDIRRISDKRPTSRWVSKKNGKTMTNVALGKTQRSLSVAYLLACTFLPIVPPLTLVGARVFHKDRNPTNHALSNLEWQGREYAKMLKFDQDVKDNKVKFNVPVFKEHFTGCYPHAVEYPLKPGYYFVPESDLPVVINRDGVLFNLATNKEVNSSRTPTYTLAGIRVDGKYVSTYVHRLLARLFDANTPLEALEVNHIDGVKHHNWLGNLEWVTPGENNRHAIETGLTAHQPVLAMDLRTGDIVKYTSAKEVALTFKINEKRFYKHLNSPRAGRLTKNWKVFKYDNEIPWPVLEQGEVGESSWDSTFGIWLAMHQTTNVLITANTLDQMAMTLNLNYPSLQNHTVRHKGEVYCGWIFVYDDAPTADRLAALPDRYKPKWMGSLPIEVTDRVENKTVIYPSRNAAARKLNIAETRIRYAMSFLGGVCDHYVFKDVNPVTSV
jgi:hypothetical protein